MLTMPNLEVSQTQKINGKHTLHIGLCSSQYISNLIARHRTAVFLKYLNPPFGLKREDMAENDCLTASVYNRPRAARIFRSHGRGSRYTYRMQEALQARARTHH